MTSPRIETVPDAKRRTLPEAPASPEADLPLRVCDECGRTFRAWRADMRFCPGRRACRRRWWNRNEQRATAAYQLLIAWRSSRGAAKGALTEIARMVDGWIAEDRAAGRRTPGKMPRA